nr:helix-turn-helix transcriptional regulator [uncultured Tyzzerella sp.]
MDKYKLGETIGFLRKQMNLTKEQLAENICSPVTISRIESGAQFPSENILKLVLNKLGQDINNVDLTNFSQNNYLYDLFDLAENYALNNNFEQTGKILQQIYEYKNLNYIEKQKLISLETFLDIQQNLSPSYQIIEKIYEALHLTKKDIDILNIDKTPLSLQEINLIAYLAIIFSREGKLQEAIEIDEKLIKCFDFYKVKSLKQNATLIMILSHLIQFYEEKMLYIKALKTCEKAIEMSKETIYNPFFCEICFTKGRLLYTMGKKEEGINILKDLYPYFKLIGNDYLVSVIDYFIKEENI